MDKRKEKTIIILLFFTIFLTGFFPEQMNSDEWGKTRDINILSMNNFYR